MNRLLLKECLDELRSDDSVELTESQKHPTEPGVQESFFSRFSNLDYLYQILDEGKDRLIDKLPSLDDAQKAQMKQFFAKRPNLESKFDWNRPDSITWDAFQNIASGYEEPIDPDTVPEFSGKRDEGDGIVSYEVQDDRAGQYAVRRIIDTHWGKDANPWCLLARDKDLASHREATKEYVNWVWDRTGFRPTWERLSDSDELKAYKEETGKDGLVGLSLDRVLNPAWKYWQEYSSVPKRIAFKDRKLLAFCATNKGRWFGEEWWDRNDYSHPSVHDCV